MSSFEEAKEGFIRGYDVYFGKDRLTYSFVSGVWLLLSHCDKSVYVVPDHFRLRQDWKIKSRYWFVRLFQ